MPHVHSSSFSLSVVAVGFGPIRFGCARPQRVPARRVCTDIILAYDAIPYGLA